MPRHKKQTVFVDFTVENYGTIFLLRPETPAGRLWVEEHVSANHEEWAGAVVVDHRLIGPLVDGLIKDGMGVR